MALDDRQLAALLQASVDFARQLLEREGGFLPFAARVMPAGNVEFAQLLDEDGGSIGNVYQRIGANVAHEARAGAILGAAVVANTRVHDLADDFETAMVVTVEAPGFARSITVPYKLTSFASGAATIELGEMIPEEGEAGLFPALN
jgi:hypothetical protein